MWSLRAKRSKAAPNGKHLLLKRALRSTRVLLQRVRGCQTSPHSFTFSHRNARTLAYLNLFADFCLLRVTFVSAWEGLTEFQKRKQELSPPPGVAGKFCSAAKGSLIQSRLCQINRGRVIQHISLTDASSPTVPRRVVPREHPTRVVKMRPLGGPTRDKKYLRVDHLESPWGLFYIADGD